MDLSRHFTLEELTHSNTAVAEGIANQPGAAELEALRALCKVVLDPLREAVGSPIKVNSGYRGPALNRRVGGEASSQHLFGQAADIQAPGTAVLELFKTVIRLALPFDQVIYEDKSATSKWVHVSHKAGANRGQILLAKFGAPGQRTTYSELSAQQALGMSAPVTRGRAAAAELEYVEGADEPAHAAAAPRPAVKRAPVARTPGAKKAAGRTSAATKPAPTRTPAKKVVSKKVAPGKTAAKKVVAVKASAKRASPTKSTAPGKTKAVRRRG